MTQPLILVTNDDGIDSDGLWAAVDALLPLGEVLVVAPDRQWSGAGRSMPRGVTGKLDDNVREFVGERPVRAYAVDASPALCVIHAMLELVPRPPALAVSGINFGENLSTEITVSGTVGAALEAATFGLPALAVSLEMSVSEHLTGSENGDYRAAQAMIRYFAERLLAYTLPFDVDVLNINVPRSATPETPWRLTRLSRHRYFVPLEPERKNGQGRPGYRVLPEPEHVEPESDIRAVLIAQQISVTPLSLDMTTRADFGTVDSYLRTSW